MRRKLRQPSPSMCVALLALFVALGGVSWAATSLPRNSVGSTQIKTGGVAASDLRAGAVTSKAVRDGGLRAVDFAAGQLPAGARGATGPQGERGPVGAKGDTGAPGATGFEIVTSATVTVGPSDSDYYDGTTATATCPAGKRAVGGGFQAGTVASGFRTIRSRPTTDGTGWEAYFWNGDATMVGGTAFAVCVAG
jgi:hypothetical protein